MADMTGEGGPARPQPRFLRGDVIAGLIFAIVGAAAWFEAQRLAPGELRNFGPGMVPRVLSAVLFLTGVVLAVRGVLQRRPDAVPVSVHLRGPLFIGLSVFFFAATIRGLPLGPVAVPQLGLAVAGPITVVIAGYAERSASLRDLLALGFGLTALCLVVFIEALSVPLTALPRVLEDLVIPRPGELFTTRIVYVAWTLLTIAIVRFVPRERAGA